MTGYSKNLSRSMWTLLLHAAESLALAAETLAVWVVGFCAVLKL